MLAAGGDAVGGSLDAGIEQVFELRNACADIRGEGGDVELQVVLDVLDAGRHGAGHVVDAAGHQAHDLRATALHRVRDGRGAVFDNRHEGRGAAVEDASAAATAPATAEFN